MTINLSEDFKSARQELINSIKNGESEETQAKLYEGMLNELFEESKNKRLKKRKKWHH